jgi:hypothetical protein
MIEMELREGSCSIKVNVDLLSAFRAFYHFYPHPLSKTNQGIVNAEANPFSAKLYSIIRLFY